MSSPQGSVLHLAYHGSCLSARFPPSEFPQSLPVLHSLETVSGLDLGQSGLEPPRDVPLDHDVPDGPLSLHLDVVLQEPPLHPLLAVVSLVGETLLHVLVEVEHLVLGLLLEALQPGVDLLVVLVEVAQDVLLVLLDGLADPLQQRTAVTMVRSLCPLSGPGFLAVFLLCPDVALVVRSVGGGQRGQVCAVTGRFGVLTECFPLSLSDGALSLSLSDGLPHPGDLLCAGLQVTDDVLDAVALQYRHYVTQLLPHGNVQGSLILLVADVGVGAPLHQDPGQLLPPHGGSNVEGSVSVLKESGEITRTSVSWSTLFCSDTRHLALIRILMTPAWPYLAAVWKGVSPYCNMTRSLTAG